MKIIFNIATHGNERMGVDVVKEIQKLNIDHSRHNFIFQKANKKAFELNKRFIHQDLNRSFPGKKNGNYEEQLAYKLSSTIRSADLVIDIHSTTSSSKNTIIITKLNKITLDYVKSISPKYVLFMKYKKNCALISQAKVGIAFEYGKDKNKSTIKKTVLGIKRLLNYLEIVDHKIPKSKIKTQYFEVTSTVSSPKGYKIIKGIKNHNLVKKNQPYAKNKNKKLLATKDFYPILFGEKEYKDFFGFQSKKLDIE